MQQFMNCIFFRLCLITIIHCSPTDWFLYLFTIVNAPWPNLSENISLSLSSLHLASLSGGPNSIPFSPATSICHHIAITITTKLVILQGPNLLDPLKPPPVAVIKQSVYRTIKHFQFDIPQVQPASERRYCGEKAAGVDNETQPVGGG